MVLLSSLRLQPRPTGMVAEGEEEEGGGSAAGGGGRGTLTEEGNRDDCGDAQDGSHDRDADADEHLLGCRGLPCRRRTCGSSEGLWGGLGSSLLLH